MQLKKKKLSDKLSFKKLAPFIAGFVLLVIFGAVVFFYRDDLFMLVPGFYQNRDYNNLTSKKNDLVEENARLLAENDTINQESMQLGTSSEDYGKKIENDHKSLENLEKLQKNMDKILVYDKDFEDMRLPSVIATYVELSMELDEVRDRLIDSSVELIEARKAMDKFNKTRAEFDECLAGINWNYSDKNISEGIKSCNQKLPELQTQLDEMKEDFDVELNDLTNYLTLLREQWEASALYYEALSQADYNKANEHDAVFADRKRQISEMEIDVFAEFNAEVIDRIIGEFEDLSKQEDEKEKEANRWYDKNVGR